MPQLNVNGKVMNYQAEPDTPLLWVILVKPSDHGQAQSSLTGQHLVNAIGLADHGLQVLHFEFPMLRIQLSQA